VNTVRVEKKKKKHGENRPGAKGRAHEPGIGEEVTSRDKEPAKKGGGSEARGELLGSQRYKRTQNQSTAGGDK